MEGLLAARGRTWSTLPLSLRSASASRVSTIWQHGLFVRHSWEAHCKLSVPFVCRQLPLKSHETANRGSVE